ncbi:hypothetical protein C8J57DRAFT_1523021 [Mycena rebaudengoi]|nr:hypothetical protein C8J57DRAFT_1523021 [Mycena rebaudengoi]
MFLQAAELSLAEIKYYRNFAFTEALGNPAHDPFFSVENAPSWMTSLGYQLYVLHDDSVESTVSWNPEDASTKDLKAYRSLILTEKYQTHPFFSLENLDAWINPPAFQVYMESWSEPRTVPEESTPISSRAPSRASSRVSVIVSSRASSPVSFHGSDMHAFPPSSRASSPVSFYESDVASHPPSPMAGNANHNSDLEHNSAQVQPDADSDSPFLAQIPLTADITPSIVPSTQTSAKSLVSKGHRIKITHQLKVDNLLYFTTVPPTFDVPHTPTAILLDLSGSCHLLKKADGSFMLVDRFIRNENQESWDGSGAHAKGDAWVHNFTSNPNQKFKCRRHTLTCNGVDKCQFLDPELFAGLERFEADENAMRELWNHELDQNEAEAASPSGIIARFYNRIQSSKCKIQCDGVPFLVRLTHASSAYGKQYFIGCSKWKRSETGSHLYWPIPPNVNEDVLRFVMENEGCLPTGPEEMNNHCVLTVHPRVGLTHCPYSHIIGGKIILAKIEHCLCPSRMIIYVPVEDLPATRHKAIVVLENPHNHPIHPMSKPGAEDKLKLKTAVNAAGLNGLTVQKLLNGWFSTLYYSLLHVSIYQGS